MRKCHKCEVDKDQGEKNAYFLIEKDTYICRTCLGLQESKHGQRQPHKQIWNRWVCNTHKCGSYNYNMLIRHETPWCEIVDQETVGIVKPKSFGGHNGDLSRKWLKDWNDYFTQAARRLAMVKRWNKYSRSKRNANRPKRVSRYTRKRT